MKWPQNKKIKKKKPVTVMFVPGNTNKARKITLTERTIKIMSSAVILIILLVLMSSWMAVSDRMEIRRVNEIKQENRDKDKTIQNMKKQMEEIQTQQEALTKKQLQLQKMMGIRAESEETPSRGMIRTNNHEILNQTEIIREDINDKSRALDKYIETVKKNQTYYKARPNQWPSRGEISSDYGWRESPFKSRNESFHDGIDIAGQVGSPILAAGDGTVTFSGWKPVYGKTIEIDHGYGIISRYGHNSQLLVESGEKVAKGQQIALMGTTGRSTGPHVHFTIIKAGTTQDPLLYLP
jgi:murein DD-endopeptidase MepM/ murein hydrolase activator NlpD